MSNFSDSISFEKAITLKDNIYRVLSCFSNEVFLGFDDEKGIQVIQCTTERIFKGKSVTVSIKVDFYENEIKFFFETVSKDKEDANDYTTDLQLFYYQEIRIPTMDITNTVNKQFTIRIYKLIYNSSPISGDYSINEFYDHVKTISFKTLYPIPRDVPYTEHIICFDIQLFANNFEQARNLANNIIHEFCDYLSVLLDLAFHEPTSKYINFLIQNHSQIECKRYRTAFSDMDLKILVKDNFNGLCPYKEAANKNFINGYYSLSFGNTDDPLSTLNSSIVRKVGNISAIEDIFRKHRIYKVQGKNQCTYSDSIDYKIHYLNSEIKVPRQIRSYYRAICDYKTKFYSLYEFFRNACRLYNQSKLCAETSPSLEISLLVASIETLSKTEKSNFSSFVNKYTDECSKKLINDMYDIRSKLFHAGEFSFLEYNLSVNPFSNKQYNDYSKKYIEYKSILRECFIKWINENFRLKND